MLLSWLSVPSVEVEFQGGWWWYYCSPQHLSSKQWTALVFPCKAAATRVGGGNGGRR
ncbi:hypothetical protein M440DRAFT_126288 [Trichoderma longibrachiatum ATCC 18648]|uniref:Uncharacterized protein n=1 Tax=Trichoderma longibrachiatum ATCC 18648 TaxID=983965 RepID=A0A2T4BXS8_TRILO|nr:hypothetical protein M440DRAFT_126288 [Trichoderma longibrachiatum ATCC 18648]